MFPIATAKLAHLASTAIPETRHFIFRSLPGKRQPFSYLVPSHSAHIYRLENSLSFRRALMIHPTWLPLVPRLKNVYDEHIAKVELIPMERLKASSGVFKYCVAQHPETRALSVLVTDNISAAHTGMQQIAEGQGLYIVMAGHIHLNARKYRESEVLMITNTSGHLQPEGTNDQQIIAEQAFIQAGLPSAQGAYKHRQWDEKRQRYMGAPILAETAIDRQTPSANG